MVFRKARLIVATAILFAAQHGYSQQDIWIYLGQIPIDFDQSDFAAIKALDEKKEEASKMIRTAFIIRDLDEMKSSYDSLFAVASAKFRIYDQYGSNLLIRISNKGSFPNEFERPAQFERRALSYMEKSEVIISEAHKAKTVEEADRLYKIAYDLKLVALLHKARALWIYNDFPQIRAYDWDNDFTFLSDSPGRLVREIEIRINGNNDIDIDSDGVIPSSGLYYIIQIAAHNIDMDDSSLNALYSGNLKVNVLFEDNWYKYFIGPFKSYKETETVMKSNNIDIGFIAAYNNGIRISVVDAIDIENR